MSKKQQEKSQQTMTELMASAIELFGTNGFVGTSVAEITEHAGYAKGSFYRHWNSKDELFLLIVEQKLKQYRQSRNGKVHSARNLEEALDVIWDFLESITHDQKWSTIFLEFTVYSAQSENLRTRMNQSVYRLSNDIFADLVREHVQTDYPPEKLGAINTALFEGYLIHRTLGTQVLSFDDVRSAAISLALQNGTIQN
ncbi:TetR/AcrR family transcriptional regulator [Pseudodesulfovibrio piezophilus]|uniref:Transcriptional regulator, TetR family n=1 Tax=Pseudodesulfovibrio piezophilus (strain DSM 21447 / JCM 15486 / C1TLV30) TaxID=1322246 RepID=M1WPW0_PSEP2|nr:TetR/AcrR family transcriptional regulator [Pseudodesulfovibrio piezophilus]CCH48619.1 Transcriptional regulator, TetR family [Pseudodesulfovibrio piezophilus C1TLV30]